jgi:GNAT superfamily N-acetyltransferase
VSKTAIAMRPIEDQALVRETLMKVFTVDHLLVMGRPYPVSELDVIGAYDEADSLIGLALWTIKGPNALLPAVISLSPRRGVARALIDHVRDLAKQGGARKLRTMTTNDNLDALRFYQLYGFRMTALFVNALDMLRALHPSLDKMGYNGIPRRDAIELEMEL